MNSKLEATKVKVHAAFCDNIDTRTVLETLKELVGSANAYVEANRATPGGINRQLLRGTALYITRIFDVLGLVARGEEPVGFPAAGGGGGGSADLETQVLPYLTALADFRDSVRKSAIEAKAVPILQECDRLRDDVLPNLGVRKDNTFRKNLSIYFRLVVYGTVGYTVWYGTRLTVLWIRIRGGPWTRSRRAKMTQKRRKKLINFIF